MKKARFITLSLIIVVSLLGLSACTNRSSHSEKRITITFWHGMTDTRKDALNDLIHDFNDSQSKYKVVAESQGDFSSLQQKITAAAKSKSLPTIAQTTYTNVPDYLKGGFITPLTPYLTAKDVADVSPVFLKSSQYHHQTYSLPFSKSIQVLFYNKDLLKQAGLPVPTTWQEIQQDSQQLEKQKITTLALDQSWVIQFHDLAYQAGSPLVADNLKVNIDSPSTIAATNVIYQMLQNKTAITAGNDGYGSVNFLKGRTMFYTGSSAGISTMLASTPKNIHWGTAVMPSYEGKHGVSVAGNDIVLFKSAATKQRQGAATFMKFLLSTKQTTKWAEKTGYLPLTKAAQQSTEYQNYVAENPTAKAVVQSIKYGHQDPAFLSYPQYLAELYQASDKMTVSHQSPQKVLPELQRKTEQIMRENKE